MVPDFEMKQTDIQTVSGMRYCLNSDKKLDCAYKSYNGDIIY